MKTDEPFMKIALDLAATCKGKTSPNPVVGAVLVKEGQIVGTGVHRKAGEPHAEVHAFRMAGEHAKDATLYVTLEPCSHYGKTPPCAELICGSGVRRVVAAMEDPNPLVAGRGFQILRRHGIEVEVGVMKAEAERLNERFVLNMTQRRPFIISKVAMTLDGKLAAQTGHSQWITGEQARCEVHRLRSEVDAILVGIGTVLADNPRLTARLPDNRKHPVRVILDSHLRLPVSAHVADCTEAKTWVAAKEGADSAKAHELRQRGIEILFVPEGRDGLDLRALADLLYEKGITDLLVEGGSEINGSLLRAGLIDKWVIYIAPKLLGGRNSLTPFGGADVEKMDDALDVHIHSIRKAGDDLCITAYPANRSSRHEAVCHDSGDFAGMNAMERIFHDPIMQR
ncbi:bifunctional diaminohydroxyphosphoribosylaminopyrimidine deaminase/5-amino-6-(5-phosphoribosylamino)uracil reductase RibD [Paenibacillus sp. GYB003]|uniref:bifunctional diaminohydroxyphosphoribosylaminopyrimidine deaminase/5-amino-6-(5-phosphoribosylamino)uracil reductase RibD n=1 Tax=Paenibacillus sp. GYB003 TaxID=2994392 RepID=UPI002F9611AA